MPGLWMPGRNSMYARLLSVVLALSLMVGCQSPPRYVPSEQGSAPQLRYVVVDLVTSATLAAREPEVLVPLASVTKMLTAWAALDAMGEPHTFETTLRAVSAPKAGALAGDLYLVGGGDPLLYASHLMALAMQLKNAGVKRVQGGIIFDDSLYARSPFIDKDTAPEHYNSGVSALSVEFNQAHLRRAAGGKDFVLPPQFPNDDQGHPPEPDAKGILRLPVKDPSVATAQLFQWLAERQGLLFGAKIKRGKTPKGAKVLAHHKSESLREVVSKMLEFSNNNVAELVGLAVAKADGKTSPGLSDAGLAVQARVERAAGLSQGSLMLKNASGLSVSNVASSKVMGQLLQRLDSGHFAELMAAFPVANWSGSLADRFASADLAFRVWAKTGTLDGACALAGYLFPRSGKRLAFFLSATDEGFRASLEKLPHLKRETEAEGWIRRARAAQEEIVARWVREL